MFGERLKAIIDSSGLTRDDFARVTGISRSKLFRFLKDDQDLKTSYYKILKKKFPWINLNWLITGEGEMSVDGSIQPLPPQKTAPESTENLQNKVKNLEQHVSRLYEIIEEVKKPEIDRIIIAGKNNNDLAKHRR